MLFYVGTIVLVMRRHSKFHRYLGTIVQADYDNMKFQVKFTFCKADNTITEYLEWYRLKELRDYGIPWDTMKMDDIVKAMYAGVVTKIRKELHKVKTKKVVRFSKGLDNYLRTYERGFFRIKNTEFICDYKNYKDLDYKIEQVE